MNDEFVIHDIDEEYKTLMLELELYSDMLLSVQQDSDEYQELVQKIEAADRRICELMSLCYDE